MSSAWLVELELALVFGGVLAFAVYEIWSLRRRPSDAEPREPD